MKSASELVVLAARVRGVVLLALGHLLVLVGVGAGHVRVVLVVLRGARVWLEIFVFHCLRGLQCVSLRRA